MAKENPDTATITARTRHNLGFHHLLAAAESSARLDELERKHKGHEFGEFWHEIYHNGLTVTLMSVACLEAYCNELYFDSSKILPTFNEAFAHKFSKMADRESLLDKFELVLLARKGVKFERGVHPVQDVQALIKLRNGLVHYRSEWFDDEGEHAKLSRIIANKFTASPFLNNENLFPRAWASSAFCSWALKSVTDFMDYFYVAAELSSPVHKLIDRANHLSGGMLSENERVDN